MGAALGNTGTITGVPFLYLIDRLAQRWGIPPWELERPDRLDWLLKGLELQDIEASIKVKRT